MKDGKWKISAVFMGVALLVSAGCTLKASRNGIPPEVDALIATFSDDLAEGRYEKIYNEAADEWRRDATLEESNKVFETLKGKLGKPGNRVLHSASEQNSSNGQLPGHSFVLMYQSR